jgi:hypothetical protein
LVILQPTSPMQQQGIAAGERHQRVCARLSTRYARQL